MILLLVFVANLLKIIGYRGTNISMSSQEQETRKKRKVPAPKA